MRVVLLVLLLVFMSFGIDTHGYLHVNAAAGNTASSENVYRNIYNVGYNGNYVITGEISPRHDIFFYTVEDGHVQFIHEKKYEVKGTAKKWRPFKIMINIPNTALPDNGSIILTLYERNSTGKMIHSFPIILEQFYH